MMYKKVVLRLRWSWLQWKDPNKIWAGSGNPCTKEDMDIFYTAIKISLGNGNKTPFWQAPWLHGRRPIDVAPLIFEISKRKNWVVSKALHDNSWVEKIDLEKSFTIHHFNQFLELWMLLSTVQLNELVDDDITWSPMANTPPNPHMRCNSWA
jgi:hypothetical protein